MKKMKKIILLIAIMCSFVIVKAQEYDKWTIDAGVGIHGISDKSATIYKVGLDNYNFGARYNLSRTFALGGRVNIGHTIQIEGREIDNGVISDNYTQYNLNFNTFHVEGVINAFNLLDLHSNRTTLLLHGGMGISSINTNNNYDEIVPSWAGGVAAVYKINKTLALKVDFTSVGNVQQSKTLDGNVKANMAGISSMVHSVSIGLSVNLGKKGSADFAEEYHRVDTIYIDTTIYIKSEPIVNNIYTNNSTCECLNSEYVFFDHDKSDIKETELNTIYKVYNQLNEDESIKLVIKGWASPTNSSNEYNMILSQHRSQKLFDTFVKLGINPERISYESYGKDFDKSDESIYEFARRVELILQKD